jgi:hypothetical protein
LHAWLPVSHLQNGSRSRLTEAGLVEILWTDRGLPVHASWADKFFATASAQTPAFAPREGTFRMALRLRALPASLESVLAIGLDGGRSRHNVSQVRITETINGRPYVIEVTSVGRDRWRAQLSRRGGSTALMPFYGPTPDEAAGLLTRWLTRVSGSVTAGPAAPGPVLR